MHTRRICASSLNNVSPAGARLPTPECHWADVVDETRADTDGQGAPGTKDSVGGQNHSSGRCKPCAFFHTKGCESGLDCTFCHFCPAYEKQRRKRLRQQICHDLHTSYDKRHSRERQPQMRHSRQHSNVSAGTISTGTGPSHSDESRRHSIQSLHSARSQWDDERGLKAELDSSNGTVLGPPPTSQSAQKQFSFAPGSDVATPPQMAPVLGPSNHSSLGAAASPDNCYVIEGPPMIDGRQFLAPSMDYQSQEIQPAGYVTYDGVQYAIVAVPAPAQHYFPDTEHMMPPPLCDGGTPAYDHVYSRGPVDSWETYQSPMLQHEMAVQHDNYIKSGGMADYRYDFLSNQSSLVYA